MKIINKLRLSKLKSLIKRIFFNIKYLISIKIKYNSKKYNVKTDLKIYIYKLDKKYIRTFDLPMVSETFFSIYYFFKNNCFTKNYSEADFFFVPLNLVQFQYKSMDPKSILNELKYFNLNNKNHILCVLGDCSPRSKKSHYVKSVISTYNWLDNFILLVLESTSDLIEKQDIGIIPINTLTDKQSFNTNKRIFLYSFLGGMEYEFLPKYHVRRKINLLTKKEDILIENRLNNKLRKKLLKFYKTNNDYELVARNSIFTLCPAGYGSWTYRFFQSINWGSIPVLFSDGYIKPFKNFIDYDSFTITLPEKDILSVDKILRKISEKDIEKLQFNLRENLKYFTKKYFFKMLTKNLEERKRYFKN